MQLFEVLPDKFFSVLTSKNRAIYAAALFVIRDAFKNEELTISREQVFSALADRLRYMLPSADLSEDDETFAFPLDGVNGKVNAIIARLKSCGWIDFEYSSANSLEENVTIPDYSLSIINALYSLTVEKKQEYRGYIFASYATLKIASESRNDYYNALSIAYDNTTEYLEALKVLYNNIRRYIQRSASLGVNELLAEHFDKYSVKITKALLDPIKTTDSVQRYKFQILSILNAWQESEEVISAILAEMGGDGESDEEERKLRILSMMDFIIDTYESVERTIEKIDERHRQYMHLSIDSMRYKMSSGTGTGTLITKLLDRSASDKKLKESLISVLDLNEFHYAAPSSLYSRVERTDARDGEGEPVARYAENTELVSAFLTELENQYGSQRVDAFVLSILAGRREIKSEDFPIDSTENFILFLLATLRSGVPSCSYEVIFDPEGKETDVMGYKVPKAIFRLKENKNGL